MTEQEAIARWLESESKNNALLKENSDLRNQVYELTMKLTTTAARAFSAEMMNAVLGPAAFLGSKGQS